MADTSYCRVPVTKVALPSCVSLQSVETIYSIANERLAKSQGFRLLLDMSAVHQIEQEGLTRLYDLTQLMKSCGVQKIILRRPNRVIRDALILSNTMNLFEIHDDA